MARLDLGNAVWTADVRGNRAADGRGDAGAGGGARAGMCGLAVLLGVALTLGMQGYQFGKSNHTVYLIDALRHSQPELLANDWFATKTLQYHAAFGLITRGLMDLGIVEPVFFAGYLALVMLFHVAWWRIVRTLGGSLTAFVLSELLFHVLAGGTGLGMYQFLQDAAFLPSNLSAVALLWGLSFHLAGQRVPSAVLIGVAGLFHLNYALVGPLIWIVLVGQSWWRDARRPTSTEIGAFLVMSVLSLANVIPALLVTWQQSGRMPLDEFVSLYVRLRHPHHYDALSWSPALWITFLAPIPFAWLSWKRVSSAEVTDPSPVTATREARRTVGLILLLLLAALLGAGIWFVSETLVQLSLWRFSAFVKVLTCAGAAIWIERRTGRWRRAIAGAAVAASAAIVVACLVRGPYLGLFRIPQDPPAYLAACDWIAANTPVDAVFLVPPDEQAFRLRAKRAIIVNFKSVPQLSGELGAWRERLSQVLAMADLSDLPRPFARTLDAIAEQYEALPPEHLERVAGRYGARYVLVGHRLPEAWEARRVNLPANGSWFLYDLRAE